MITGSFFFFVEFRIEELPILNFLGKKNQKKKPLVPVISHTSKEPAKNC
jgi:hypothetical protein